MNSPVGQESPLALVSECWPMYFPGEVFDAGEHELHLQLIKSAMQFFFQDDGSRLTDQVYTSGDYVLHYGELFASESSAGFDGSIDIAGLLVDKPAFALGCLSTGLHLAAYLHSAQRLKRAADDAEQPTARWAPAFDKHKKMTVRVRDLSPITPLKRLKSNSIGKLLAVRGTVVRVSNVRPVVTEMPFMCTACHTVIGQQFEDGKYRAPALCAQSPACRSRDFLPDRAGAKTVDWQTIRIQEQTPDEQNSESGRMPRSIECELTGSLVDSCVPGDVATVVGLVKVVNTQETVGSGRILDPNRSMFLIYLDANSVQTSKRSSSSSLSSSMSTSSSGSSASSTSGSAAAAAGKNDGGGPVDKLHSAFHFKDLYCIREISEQPHLFGLLVNSLAPGIFGHHLVKAGLLLSLFGGVQRTDSGRGKLNIRGDLHMLVVGDPGMGKSQMLRAVAGVAPRCVLVCGSHSSDTGLTVTLHKERGSGDFTLEAGALVLADQGVCCVDEFDKIGKHHAALLEAMEQQSISVAKAGIVCSLPARCSVLAAANPIGGHYNKAKTIPENIGMSSAILSRFDLIFVLVDRPDEQFDKRLSEHVMQLHDRDADALLVHQRHNTRRARAPPRPPRYERNDDDDDDDDDDSDRADSLAAYLQQIESQPLDLIPAALLRKYISYARQYCRPTFTPEATTILQRYYLEMRQAALSLDCTPVTTRQLESLVRLAEARARAELRDRITADDARDVVALMRESRQTIEQDDIGVTEGDFVPTSTGKMSKQKQLADFCHRAAAAAKAAGSFLFTRHELSRFVSTGPLSFDEIVDALNTNGTLLKRGTGSYELMRGR